MPEANDSTGGKAEARPHVVIVGAGFAGLAAAEELSRRPVEITVVDRQNHHVFQPLLYQVATAGLSPADIAAPIRSIVAKQRSTRVLLDRVEGVEPDNRRVMLASGASLTYDALILATGARHSFFGRDEWGQHALGLKTIDDAIRVRRMVLLALETAETTRQENIAERAEFLTFVVVGGGPTGVETAGAIAELTRHSAEMEFRYVTSHCVRIILIEAGERLLATFPEKLSASAKKALESLGVEIRLKSRVDNIDSRSVTIGSDRINAATIIWAAGVKASPAAAWLQVEADGAGRVKVAEDLSVPGHPEIFVVGDTATLKDSRGRVVPGVAPAAKQQGRHAAQVIAAKLLNRKHPGPFRYRNYGNLATIGRKFAVADFGFMRLGGLIAWLLWSTAHIYFLVGFRNRIVVGANWLWNYVTFDRGARLITGLGDDPAERPAAAIPERIESRQRA